MSPGLCSEEDKQQKQNNNDENKKKKKKEENYKRYNVPLFLNVSYSFSMSLSLVTLVVKSVNSLLLLIDDKTNFFHMMISYSSINYMISLSETATPTDSSH